MSTEQRVKLVVAECMGLDASEIKNESRIADDLGADSLDQIEILLAIEEEFSRSISDEDGEKFVTVQDVIAYLGRAPCH